MESIFKLSADILADNVMGYRRCFLEQDPFPLGMSILLGQRGVGKTTVLHHFIRDYYKKQNKTEESQKALYVPVDHFVIKASGLALYEIAEQFYQLGGELICFDEIHKYSDWSMELKSIYDTFSKLKVVASGSSTLEIQKGSHDLSRRAFVCRLYGFSFREFVEYKTGLSFSTLAYEDILKKHESLASDICQQLKVKEARILSLFKDYLEWGYYPYFIDVVKTKTQYQSIIDQNLNSVLEGDLLCVHNELTGASVKKLKQLLGKIAGLVPFKPDLENLRRTLDVGDQRTLKTYLKYLQDAEIINTLCKEGKSLNYLDKPEKIYLSNTNISHAIAAEKADKGSVRETFFLNMMKPVLPVFYNREGDFRVEDAIIEIGGKGKGFGQIKAYGDAAYLAIDDIEVGLGNKIPLWLFGWLR